MTHHILGEGVGRRKRRRGERIKLSRLKVWRKPSAISKGRPSVTSRENFPVSKVTTLASASPTTGSRQSRVYCHLRSYRRRTFIQDPLRDHFVLLARPAVTKRRQTPPLSPIRAARTILCLPVAPFVRSPRGPLQMEKCPRELCRSFHSRILICVDCQHPGMRS